MSCALEYGRFRHCVRQITGNWDDAVKAIKEREEHGFQLVGLLHIPIKGASFDTYNLVFKRLLTIDNISATDWE